MNPRTKIYLNLSFLKIKVFMIHHTLHGALGPRGFQSLQLINLLTLPQRHGGVCGIVRKKRHTTLQEEDIRRMKSLPTHQARNADSYHSMWHRLYSICGHPQRVHIMLVSAQR